MNSYNSNIEKAPPPKSSRLNLTVISTESEKEAKQKADAYFAEVLVIETVHKAPRQ